MTIRAGSHTTGIHMTLLAGLLLGVPSLAVAETIVVSEGESIQAAIDDPETADGDVILVEPGVYNEMIDMRGKAIALRSADGPAVTTIDAEGFGTVISCYSGEGPDTVIEGFTITGGSGLGGGGMWILNGSPTVVNCVFLANQAFYEGGGMLNDNAAPTVVNCSFLGNVGFFGGGMSNIYSTPLVVNCLFSGNVAENGGTGGGIDNLTESDATIANCTFYRNTAAVGGAMNNSNSAPTISNCVMWGSMADMEGDEIASSGSTLPVISYSLVAGSGGSATWDEMLGLDGGGNIDADPMFIDADGADDVAGTVDDDLRLSDGSAAIDAASNADVPADAADLDDDGDAAEAVPVDRDGAERFLDDWATDDSGSGEPPLVDMGAYEYQPGDPPAAGPALDIRPGECPNEIDVRFGGWISVGLLGTQGFDVREVNLRSLRLTRVDGEGRWVRPRGFWRSRGLLRDVGTPFESDEMCGCHELGGDGVLDLSLRFYTRSVVRRLALKQLTGGSMVKLQLTGELVDGTPFSAVDCIKIMPEPQACEGDVNGDGFVNAYDLYAVIFAWGSDDADADVNDDGWVNVFDLIIVLQNWGACP